MVEIPEALKAALYASFDQKTMQADAVLRVLNAESRLAGRVSFMTYVVSNFGLPTDRRYACPLSDPLVMSDEKFQEYRNKLRIRLIAIATPIHKGRLEESEVARRFLVFLETIETREERAVALALLLWSPLVPYVQIPADMVRRRTCDVPKVIMRPAVRRSLALTRRLMVNQPSRVAWSQMVVRILSEHPDEDEKAILIEYAASLGMARELSKIAGIARVSGSDDRASDGGLPPMPSPFGGKTFVGSA